MGEVAAVDPGAAQQAPGGAEQRDALDRAAVGEPAVGHIDRELEQLVGADPTGLGGGGHHRADQRARRGSRDAFEGIAGVAQRADGADQPDPFDSAAGQHEICARRISLRNHHSRVT